MNDRETAVAFGKRLNERFTALEQRVAKADADSNVARSVFMPGTNVEVDTGPIAETISKFSEHFEGAFLAALDKFSEGFKEAFSESIDGLIERCAEKLMEKMDLLINALATRPGITFSPTITPSEVRVQPVHAPEVNLDVHPSPVTVQHPVNVPPMQFPERPKRTLRISHSDGTESVIREE